MNHKRLLIIFSLFLLSSCSGKISSFSTNNSKKEKTWSALNLDTTYVLGEHFRLPERTFTLNGEESKAECYLIYPSMKTSFETEQILNEPGSYTLRYTANFGNKKYTTDESFVVYDSMMKVTGSQSSLQYGLYDKYDANSYGSIVRLKQGDSLLFTGLTDFEDLTTKDTLIKGFITPDIQGSPDFARLTFHYEDALDPSVFLEFRLQFFDNASSQGISYVTGSLDGVNFSGREDKTRIRKNMDTGTPISSSFTATENKGGYWAGENVIAAPDKNQFSLSYDSAAKQLFANGKFVCDFDDLDYFDSIFNGFPSGKAKLSVFASSYKSSSANFVLTHVNGVSLSINRFVDTVGPNITLSEEKLPNARCGIDCTYPIPKATAFDDVSGEVEVQATPYYGYTSSDPLSLSVTDNRFKVNRLGEYAIEYKAKDYSGNESVKVLYFEAVSDLPELVASEPLDLEKTAYLGEYFKMEEPVIKGGSGKTTYEVFSLHGGNRVKVVDKLQFVELGSWEFECVVSDFIGDVSKFNFSIQVQASSSPVFADNYTLPKAFISGSSYSVPSYYCYIENKGKLEKKECDIKVEDKNGSHIYKPSERFIPEVENQGDYVKVSYTYQGKDSAIDSVPCAVVRKNNSLKLDNYFLSKNLIKTTNSSIGGYNGIKLEKEKDDDASFLFANLQVARDFSLHFSNVPNNSDFEKIRFTLIDSLDDSIRVGMELSSANANTITANVINGSSYTITKKSLIAQQAYDFALSFANNSFSFELVSLQTRQTINGEPFNGFPSKKVYLQVEMIGGKASNSLLFTRIGSNNLIGSSDLARPVIFVDGDYGGSFPIHSSYKTQVALVGDVLCPNVSSTVSVVYQGTEREENVLTEDGISLDKANADKQYTFKLDKPGEYTLTYTAKEENWLGSKKSTYTYSIYAVDQIAPTFSFVEEPITKGKVNTYYSLPDYVVSDDISSKENIQVFVTVSKPNGDLYELNNWKEKILLEEEGDYVFSIYVLDESKNATHVILRVEVSA